MISRGIEVNSLAQFCLILEAEFFNELQRFQSYTIIFLLRDYTLRNIFREMVKKASFINIIIFLYNVRIK